MKQYLCVVYSRNVCAVVHAHSKVKAKKLVARKLDIPIKNLNCEPRLVGKVADPECKIERVTNLKFDSI